MLTVKKIAGTALAVLCAASLFFAALVREGFVAFGAYFVWIFAGAGAVFLAGAAVFVPGAVTPREKAAAAPPPVQAPPPPPPEFREPEKHYVGATVMMFQNENGSGGDFEATVPLARRRGLLLCWEADGQRRETEVSLFPATVGRDGANGAVIDAPSVSRRHAEITQSGGVYRVADLGSSNGTFLGGERVSGSAAIANGDTVSFGSVAVTVLDLSLT
ncbi:MAG: FHA domain-containing protein [Oscillospiraceae bacterium]|jgi:hypothetical protein|nr:FHA domain-containing protein [Oscillospiraceae bacterium]